MQCMDLEVHGTHKEFCIKIYPIDNDFIYLFILLIQCSYQPGNGRLSPFFRLVCRLLIWKTSKSKQNERNFPAVVTFRCSNNYNKTNISTHFAKLIIIQSNRVVNKKRLFQVPQKSDKNFGSDSLVDEDVLSTSQSTKESKITFPCEIKST